MMKRRGGIYEGISISCERRSFGFVCRTLSPEELRAKLGLPARATLQ
jgi:hypothetical protein